MPRRWCAAGALLLLVCCRGQSQRSVAVVRDSAGVRIVQNSGLDTLLGWTFVRRYAVGGAASGPGSFASLWPGQVAVRPAGGLAILDRQAAHVVLFDSTGEVAGLVGRRGGGPGELEFPYGLAVAPGGTIWVTDIQKSAFLRYAPDSAPLPPIPFRRPGPQTMYAVGRDTLVLLERLEDRPAARQQYRLVYAAAGDTTVLALGPGLQAREAAFASCRVSYAALPIFVMLPMVAAGGGRVAAAMTPEYRVDVFRHGTMALSIRRAIAPLPATAQSARREVGDGMDMQVGAAPCHIPASEMIEQMGMAEDVPALKGAAALAPDGMLWIQRHTWPDEPRRTDIFRPDGTYQGTLENAPVPLAFLPSGDLVTIEQDSLGVQRVAVYRRED